MIKQKTRPSIRQSGFTLVEIVVAVSVIAILAAIITISVSGIQMKARDSQRSTSARVIGETLEKYYTENGEYPGCTTVTDFTDGVLKGLDKSTLIAPSSPDKTQPSVKCQNMANATTDFYAYVGDGTNTCLTGDFCTSWTLKYKEEASNSVKSISSRRAIASSAPSAPVDVVVTATNLGANGAAGTVAVVTCNIGTPQYAMSSRTNADPWTAYTSWSTSRALSIASTNEGGRYSFRAQARCVFQADSFSAVTSSNEADYIRPITIPPAPVLVQSPVGTAGGSSTLTYSWAAVSCPTGTTVEYGRAWGRDDPTGYRAYVTTSTLSYAVSSSYQGYQYKAKVRAQCKSPYTASGWSVDSNEPVYLRWVVAPSKATNFRSESSGNSQYPLQFTADPPSCGLGTVREGRWRYFTEAKNWTPPFSTQYGGTINTFKSAQSTTQQINRWKTATTISTSELDLSPRTYNDPDTGTSKTSYIGAYEALDAPIVLYGGVLNLRMVVQYRCINSDTGLLAEGLHADGTVKNF